MYRDSAELYDAIYGFKDYRGEAGKLAALIAGRHPRAGTLLDIACGSGRHLEHLRERFAVQGLDLTEGLLAAARRRLPEVPLHRGDMRSFELPDRFDVITCLFSAVGYLHSPEALNEAAATWRRHLAPGGLILVEPWLLPEVYREGKVHLHTVDEPDLKIARMNLSERRGRLAVMDMHHLVGTAEGVRHFVEHHELFLFTREEYVDAFARQGLETVFEEQSPTGRGLVVAQDRS